jgi:hypothetical protein
VFRLIPCRKIMGDCTGPIGSAVLYIYRSHTTLRAKEPYKPWKPRNLVPWELRNLYTYVDMSTLFIEALNLH